MKNIDMNFLNLIIAISDEKKIPRDNVVDVLKNSIIKAYIKEYPEELIEVNIDIDKNIFNIYSVFNVVEPYDDINDYCELTIEEANKYFKSIKKEQNAKVGDVIKKPLNPELLSSKIVEHIVQIFKQNIAVQANNQIYEQWKDKINQLIYAEVEKNDNHGIYVNLENGLMGFLSNKDTIPNEKLIPGQKYYFLIKEVKQQSSGWPIVLTRTSETLVKKLLEKEVPELQDNIIEIIDIARVPGFKTKISVISHQVGIEPCGTIIGPKASRIQSVSMNLNYERIEVIEYNDDFESYLIDTCSPAQISGYKVVAEANEEHKKQVIIIVPSNQLPLLLGKLGNNIRLISKLLNCDTDVKTPEAAAAEQINYNHLETKSTHERKFEKVLLRNKGSYVVYNKNNAQSNSDNQDNVHVIDNSTSSLLNKIDSFDYDTWSVSNESNKKTKKTIEKSNENKVQPKLKHTEKTIKINNMDLLQKLQSTEATRLENKTTQDIELVETLKKNKDTKKPKKWNKTKNISKQIDNSKISVSSIMDSFTDADQESILNQLNEENQNREDIDDSYDDSYDDLNDKQD